MKPFRTSLDRTGIWLLLNRCYQDEARRDAKRPDYWLARAAKAELEAAAS